MKSLSYPFFPAGDAKLSLPGVVAPDPFAWMEDASAADLRPWLDAQSELVQDWLEGSNAFERASRIIAEMPNLDLAGIAAAGGDNLFFIRRSPKGEEPELWVKAGADGEPVLLASTETENGAVLSRHGLYPSPSGRFVLYTVKPPGLELWEVRGREVATGRPLHLGDTLSLYPSATWHPDESGFYFNLLRGVHLDTDASQGRNGIHWRTVDGNGGLVLPIAWDGGWTALPIITPDCKWLILDQRNLVTRACGLAARPLSGGDVVTLVEPCGSHVAYVANEGDSFIVLRGGEGDLGKLAELHVAQHGVQECRTANLGAPLARTPYPGVNVSLAVGDEIVVGVYRDGHAELRRYGRSDFLLRGVLVPPALATINALISWQGSMAVFAEAAAFPHTLFTIDLDGVWQAVLGGGEHGFPNLAWHTLLLERPGETSVPVSVILPDGRRTETACLLHVYGALGAPLTCRFREEVWATMRAGCAYAIAHVRGGGERGHEWWVAGRGAAKQVTLDDLYAVAEALVDQGITTRQKLMLKGESFGAYVVSVAYAQRPDLFAGIVGEVPLADIIRQARGPAGAATRVEVGDPLQSAEEARRVLALSPLQRLESAAHKPALLYIIGEHDPNCPPRQAFRFIAEAQRLATSNQPVLMEVIPGVGHAAWHRSARTRAALLTTAFLLAVTGAQP